MGSFRVATAANNHVAQLDGDVLFLLGVSEAIDDSELEGTFLEGIETIKTKVVRVSDQTWRVIDEPDGDGFLGIENEFLVSAGGRLVYEAEDQVISIRPDGSERLDLTGWRWLGGSISALSSTGSAAQLDSIEVSEVFLTNDANELAAISTSDPEAGMVNFGTLPNSATSVQLFGLAPGPHRLAQTTLAGQPDSYEVIYLSTRDKDSMQVISAQASTQDNQRPVSGF